VCGFVSIGFDFNNRFWLTRRFLAASLSVCWLVVVPDFCDAVAGFFLWNTNDAKASLMVRKAPTFSTKSHLSDTGST
jgi:hypothetical protein